MDEYKWMENDYLRLMYKLDYISGFTYEDTKNIPMFVSVFSRDIHTDEKEYM